MIDMFAYTKYDVSSLSRSRDILFERGWVTVTLRANVREKVGRPPTNFGVKKLESRMGAITWCCLRDPTFSRFETIPGYRRVTHTQTHRHTWSWLIPAHRSRRAGKNCVLRPVHKSLAETPYRRKFVDLEARDVSFSKRVSWEYCMKQCILSFFWRLIRANHIIGAFWSLCYEPGSTCWQAE